MRAPQCRIVFWLTAACLTLPLPAEPTAPQISPKTREALRVRLPKFDPQQGRPETAPVAAPGTSVPIERNGVVIFPDYHVVEKKTAEPHPDDWLASDVVTRREMRRLEADMTRLELLLNRWSLPLIGTSFAARARANYEAAKFRGELTRLLDLAKAVETFDPKAAHELRDALDFSKLPKERRK